MKNLIYRFVGVCLTGALLLEFASAPSAAHAPRPTAAVALGDSWTAGTGAGDYDSGRCLASANAAIHTGQFGVDQTINLACAGATTMEVGPGPGTQVARLAELARTRDVRVIVVSIGGNDLGFRDMVTFCAIAYVFGSPGCAATLPQVFAQRLAATTPKVERTLRAIRQVMGSRHYRLILQGYASPITEDMRYTANRLAFGCPFSNEDARWARTDAVPAMSRAWAKIAARTGSDFVDLSVAMKGREVCSSGITPAQEWIRGVDLNALDESLHPNVIGQRQIGRCLTQFYRQRATSARCIRGADGHLSSKAWSATP